MSTFDPSASARPLVSSGMALAMPRLPVLVPTPVPVRLNHSSSVNWAVASPGAAPNVTYWVDPFSCTPKLGAPAAATRVGANAVNVLATSSSDWIATARLTPRCGRRATTAPSPFLDRGRPSRPRETGTPRVAHVGRLGLSDLRPCPLSAADRTNPRSPRATSTVKLMVRERNAVRPWSQSRPRTYLPSVDASRDGRLKSWPNL